MGIRFLARRRPALRVFDPPRRPRRRPAGPQAVARGARRRRVAVRGRQLDRRLGGDRRRHGSRGAADRRRAALDGALRPGRERPAAVAVDRRSVSLSASAESRCWPGPPGRPDRRTRRVRAARLGDHVGDRIALRAPCSAAAAAARQLVDADVDGRGTVDGGRCGVRRAERRRPAVAPIDPRHGLPRPDRRDRRLLRLRVARSLGTDVAWRRPTRT